MCMYLFLWRQYIVSLRFSRDSVMKTRLRTINHTIVYFIGAITMPREGKPRVFLF